MTNKTMMQYFEWYLPSDRSLWRQVASEARDLKESGIDMLWLPPAYKGANGRADVGYSVYDLYDLGEFYQKGSTETKYGSMQEYLTAIQTLHENNIEVIADIVLGHKTGADETEDIMASIDDYSDRTKRIGEERKIRAWTQFKFYARKNKYSSFKWNHNHFHGVDYDDLSHTNAIYHFHGKEWDNEVDDELGNYDYLLGADVDMSHPEVVEELTRWGLWYTNFANLDGYRLDAVKHIKFEFYRDWLLHMQEASSKNLYSVAEYWSPDLNKLLHYIEITKGRTKVFDVPLHFNMYQAATNPQYYMGNILKNTVLESKPEHAVTFIDNHDSQIGQALQSWISPWFKPLSYALILLHKDGDPCVFYSDYYGENQNHFPPVKHLKALLRLRKEKAYGTQYDYFDHEHMIGFTRSGCEEKPGSGLAVVMTNHEAGFKKMYIGTEYAGREFVDALGEFDSSVTVTIMPNGYGKFLVNEKSISVWVLKS